LPFCDLSPAEISVQTTTFGFAFGYTRENTKSGGLLRKQRAILWRVVLIGCCLLKNLGESAMLVGRKQHLKI
jgi:hypothetical protein